MKRLVALSSILLSLALLVSCASPATPEVVTVKETVVVAGTPQVVEKEVTAVPTAVPQPAVGGTLVIASPYDFDTLDVHKTTSASHPLGLIGASLITKDPDTGEYIPYLAESWTVSPDGMTYEFKLRDGIKFHDGTPLTAEDYAWTFNRALAPDSIIAGALRGLASAEAVDTHTLRLTMVFPSSVLLNTLSFFNYGQPLSKAYVEKMGADYGRNPMGVGPFKFKEWTAGEKLVLERNPDFNWGPPYAHQGAPYIETIEYRVLPEYATQLAGFEAGEVDYLTYVESKDVKRVEEAGNQIFQYLEFGAGKAVFMNTSKPPFDSLPVRQALNYAIDKEVVLKVATLGHGVALYGPISPSTDGYWPGVEYVGYHYNLEKAKALMQEAGYALNAKGVWEKDGQALEVNLLTYAFSVKDAELVQEQLQTFGITANIQQGEVTTVGEALRTGGFDLAISGFGWPDYGALFAMFHPSLIGAFNYGMVNDPELSRSLEIMATATDGAFVQQMADEAQRRIVEQAYTVPLYAFTNYIAMSSRIKDVKLWAYSAQILLFDAYIETTQ
jgi:peptide/nickel transport system substrate-binding protein